MVHRINCSRFVGPEVDIVHVAVTIDGQPTSSDTPVTFVRVRDKDTVTGKPTGPLRAGILVAGEPQYDVELLSDGVPVAAVGPRSAETEHIYDRVSEVDAEEARAARTWAREHHRPVAD